MIVNNELFDLEPYSLDKDKTIACPKRESCPPPPKFIPNISTNGLRKLLINQKMHKANIAFDEG